MSSVIRVESLTRYYGDRLAVDRICFEVQEGELFGFLGPNGAGKTTTQRMLTGVLPPSEGTAYVLDHDMATDPLGAKEHIGVVPEVANPYLELSGWRNMMLAGQLYGLDRRARGERAEKLLGEFELWERRGDIAKSYSKGMRQRLMLAMALLHEPQVLFLDEPTAGLDVASRRVIHQMVRDLAQDGVAVFYTTHNIEEANMLCGRVAIISEGRIAAIDTPESLKAAFAGSQSVQVAFDAPVEADALAHLREVRHVETEGDKLRLYTSSPGVVTMQLVDFARSKSLRVVSLNTAGPSLEEVFVSLTVSHAADDGGAGR
jgi:ABC-2 type transport system ATP-binding protein